MQAQAIAYIGFAGSLNVGEVDLPIAICKESILLGGNYQCVFGRMINIGENVAKSETGGWTDFNQDSCVANPGTVESLVGSGNPEVITYGKGMAIYREGGGMQSAFNNLRESWEDATNQNELWNRTLPVVSCPDDGCGEMVGAVNVNIVWITGAEDDPSYSDAPSEMGDWSYQDPNGETRWNVFVANFALEDNDGGPAPYKKESIYFVPDCVDHVPKGGTGEENVGVLAKVPVLVD